MRRTRVLLAAIASVPLALQGCSNAVMLEAGHYPPIVGNPEVEVIDARGMDRSQIESILDEHYVIGRFDAVIPRSDSFEEQLALEVEEMKPRTLRAGGSVLMYTDDSEIIAVIRRDARYAGAQEAVTFYAMLPRNR